MNVNEPLVSIVLPTCNRTKLLKKSVESILGQTYKNWELLAIDDNSTDSTEEMMLEFNAQYPNIKYFRILADKTPGISKYLNFGIKNARGKYISRLDDDDYWYDKDTLKLEVEFLENNLDYVLVGGGVIIVDDKYKELYKYYKKEKFEDIRKSALIANPFAHSTVMFKKDTALSLNGYSNMEFAEDWDFFLKMGLAGKCYNFQRYFTCYLSAGQNTSFKRHREQSRRLYSIIKKYKNSYPNYYKGVLLITIQYIYTFMPVFIKKRFHSFLIYFKRNYF